MTAPRRSAATSWGLALALAVIAGLLAPPPASALSAWDGSVNVYRTGVFTTQKTWYYCTAADVQIIRNIVRHEDDHSRAGQDRYFSYMRDHMRYGIPVKQGVDPAGWTYGLSTSSCSRTFTPTTSRDCRVPSGIAQSAGLSSPRLPIRPTRWLA